MVHLKNEKKNRKINKGTQLKYYQLSAIAGIVFIDQ